MSSFLRKFNRKIIAHRPTNKYVDEALYKKIFKDGSHENQVGRQLNEFMKSRKSAYKWEVGHSLKLLRRRKLYTPALKLSERMERRGMNKTVSDQGIHLDLVGKGRGLAEAEAYFIKLPEASKDHRTYGALLNLYCKELKTDKAESLIEKMKELNLLQNARPYNSLMTLYTKTGNAEKIPAIIKEMKAADVLPDVFTYNVWMRALAAFDDISGVERVIDEMKREGRVFANWTTYSNLATIYTDAGFFDKAEKALKELEKKARKDLSAYQFLIILYGRTGNLLEVYRVWRSLRLTFHRTADISYLNMIQVLVKLNDLPGAEKCFREWESVQPTNDIRIVNVLIRAYTKLGLLEKAEKLQERLQGTGAKPNAETWEIFLDYHLKNGNIKSAVNCLHKAIKTQRGNGSKWVPSSAVVEQLMEHFEQNKDVEGAERFLKIYKKAVDGLDKRLLESLLRIYASAEKKSLIMRRRVKMEDVELSEEGKRLLDAISVE